MRAGRLIGPGLALGLALVAGCEDLPTSVAVPPMSAARSPSPTPAPVTSGAAARPGASATPTPAASATPTVYPSPIYVDVGEETPSPAPSEAPASSSPSPEESLSPTPVPSGGASATPTPAASATATPTPNPAAASVSIVSPTATSDFSAASLRLTAKAELPTGVTLQKLQIFYDDVEIKAGSEATQEIAQWDPHTRAGAGVPNGRHELRAVATTAAGVVSSAVLAFDKPFVFRSWRTDFVHDGTTQVLPPLPSARSMARVVGIQNRLFSFFGQTATTDVLAEVRMLNLGVFAPSWSARPATGQTARFGSAMVAVGDRVYQLGGEALIPPTTRVLSAEVGFYDVFLDQTDNAAPNLPKALKELCAARVGGFLYAAGGESATGAESKLYRLALDAQGLPVGTAWEERAPFVDGLGRIGAAMVEHDGDLYVLGGRNERNVPVEPIIRYDPDTDTWSRETLLPNGVSNAAAASLGGYVWLFGGDAHDNPPRVLRDTIRFDPATRTVKTFAEAAINLPEGRAGMGAAVVGGRLFLVGGYRYGTTGQREYVDSVIRADTL